MHINVFDFEDGLQDIFEERTKIKIPIQKHTFDVNGHMRILPDSFLSGKNIIFLSKPYDCLESGVRKGKYPDDDSSKLHNWSRRNYRYNQEDTYELLNSTFDNVPMDCKFFIHPDDFFLNTPNLVNRLRNYLTVNDLEIDSSGFDELYKEMVNIR